MDQIEQETDADMDDDVLDATHPVIQSLLPYLPPDYVRDVGDVCSILAGTIERLRDNAIRRNPMLPKDTAHQSGVHGRISVTLVGINEETIDAKIRFVLKKPLVKMIKPKETLEYMYFSIINGRVLPNDDTTEVYIVRAEYKKAAPGEERRFSEPPSAVHILFAMSRLVEIGTKALELLEILAAYNIGPSSILS